MSWSEVLRVAWQALASHRLRATLSGAGIVFGVAAIVAALAVAEGARRRAHQEAAALGVDNAFIRARAAAGDVPAPRFTPADVDVIARELSGADVAAVRRSRGRLERDGRGVAASIAGVTPGWRNVAGLSVTGGRWFSEQDMRERRRVIVLGSAIAASLGGGTEIGSAVRWRDQWFTVIGMLGPARRAEGQAAAYVPITAADDRLAAGDAGGGAQEIALRVRDGASVDAIARAAARSLTRRGHAESTFDVVVPLALLRARLEAQRTFDWVLFAVGAIALAISGIGIMNIMLASVAERTSEIGVRRAAGARRRDVLAQFAAEAGLLCLAGGVAGVPIGAALAAMIAAGAQWPVAIAPSSVGLALLLAAAAGMAFGIYPAHRAAMIDPIEALRS